MRALGGEAVSVDPAYGQADGLVDRVAADIARIGEWQRAHPAGFNWSYLGSPEELARTWTSALEVFAADFTPDASRYVAVALDGGEPVVMALRADPRAAQDRRRWRLVHRHADFPPADQRP